MKNIVAFIVGIDRYKEPNWSILGGGPCQGALAVAEWCLLIGVSPSKIFVFLDTLDEVEGISAIRDQGVAVKESARFEVIDGFWRHTLRAHAEDDSKLLVYWSGHGFTKDQDTRLLICPDYTSAELHNRVFNASNFIGQLSGTGLNAYSQQLMIADVCGNFTKLRFTSQSDEVIERRRVEQLIFFARPSGEYTTTKNGRGFFTSVVLNVLQQFNDWPVLSEFESRMGHAFDDGIGLPYKIYKKSAFEETEQEVGGDHFGRNVGHWRRFELDSSHVIEKHKAFVGREELGARIDEVCSTPDTSRFLHICGPSGIGKTAFLANYVEKIGGARHFFAPSLGITSVSECLSNLAAQLVRKYDLYDEFPAVPIDKGVDLWKFLAAAAKRAATPVVVMVDGIDEAERGLGESVLGLPDSLPSNVVFVISSCRIEIGLSGPIYERISMTFDAPENMRDIARFLQVNSPANTPDWNEKVLENCQGSFLFANCMLRDYRAGETSIPSGLAAYYGNRIERFKALFEAGDWMDAGLRLLTLFAVCQFPISLRQIRALVSHDPTDIQEKLYAFSGILGLVSQEGGKRYSILHESFRDFVLSRQDVDSESPDVRKAVADLMLKSLQSHVQRLAQA